ncbi:hypothetical protein LCGC14_1240320 [marine sediment metagenome]|uniref:Uncharacterized protein n=1 Tax=marine sediment metagenome TaxID=412755 RepID=A0A0F9PAA2_9ZZZZ
MEDSRPEWDNQPSRCFVCMTERDAEGKCKCPPPPPINELIDTLYSATSVDADKEAD